MQVNGQMMQASCMQASCQTFEQLDSSVPLENSSAAAAGSSEVEEASCIICKDSGFQGFSVCAWCDGVPKPFKQKALQSELVIKRQTSTTFLMHECSIKQSEESMGPRLSLKPHSEPIECKICAAGEANVVLRPCGHGGFCEDCTRRLVGAKSTAFCPYCRAPIQAFLKIDPKQEISVVREEFQVKVGQWVR